MTDILARLRHREQVCRRSGNDLMAKEFAEYATEVERLRASASDVLLYLFSDCVRWTEDVDGDAHPDGTPYTIVHHDIRLTEAHLSELLDMAGIPASIMDTCKERLDRAIDADLAARTAQQSGAAL